MKISAEQKKMNEQLLQACQRGDLPEVKRLLTDPCLPLRAQINYKRHGNRNYALIEACQYGHFEIVRYLLSSKDLLEHADIHHTMRGGKNALMMACLCGHLEIVKYLIESDEITQHANIQAQDEVKYDAFFNALDSLEIVRYLLTSKKTKAQINIHRVDDTGLNALMVACCRGNLDVVKYLLTSEQLCEHSMLNTKDAFGKNALFFAIREGYQDIVQYLLPLYSFDLREANDYLLGATSYGRLNIFKYLLENSFVHQLSNEDKWEALVVASRQIGTHYHEMIEYLIFEHHLDCQNYETDYRLHIMQPQEIDILINQRRSIDLHTHLNHKLDLKPIDVKRKI